MFWVLLGLVMVAEAAKLNNAYLPPPAGAKESGGTDGALQVPLEPPYIDRYTPEEEPQTPWRPGTRSLKRGKAQPLPATNEDDQQKLDEEEDPIEKGRFISGSYSYTGPDNILVTVTYTADDKARKLEETVDEKEEDSVEEEEPQVDEEARQAVQEEEEEDEGVVPTPPTLPAALARAFDFHRKKYQEHQAALEKTQKQKKPLRGPINKNKGQHGGHKNEAADHQEGHQSSGQYGMKIPGHGAGYHYPNHQQQQDLYQTPTIHQGYSYPKQH